MITGERPTITRLKRNILGMVAKGMKDREIAAELSISARTVNWHLREIFFLLDACNRAHAVTIARDRGLLAQTRTGPAEPQHDDNVDRAGFT